MHKQEKKKTWKTDIEEVSVQPPSGEPGPRRDDGETPRGSERFYRGSRVVPARRDSASLTSAARKRQGHVVHRRRGRHVLQKLYYSRLSWFIFAPACNVIFNHVSQSAWALRRATDGSLIWNGTQLNLDNRLNVIGFSGKCTCKICLGHFRGVDFVFEWLNVIHFCVYNRR